MEGQGEGISKERDNSMERAPLPSPLPARASQGEGAGDFSDGRCIKQLKCGPPGEGAGPTIHADFQGNLAGRVPPRGDQDVDEQAASTGLTRLDDFSIGPAQALADPHQDIGYRPCRRQRQEPGPNNSLNQFPFQRLGALGGADAHNGG